MIRYSLRKEDVIQNRKKQIEVGVPNYSFSPARLADINYADIPMARGSHTQWYNTLYTGVDKTRLYTSSGSLFVILSGCPCHVERN